MWRLLLVVLVACHAQRPKLALISIGEASQYVKTGRYDEAVQLCHDFERAYAGVSCKTIGVTAQRRPIVALFVARGGAKPTIYLQGGIHAGEIDGKDAGFWFLRDLLDGKVAPGALDAVNIVFVPVINPDGHERFGPNNRPNQRGPAEMGFRTNGARLNINRDFVKADTPEIQTLLGIVRSVDPIVFVDLHATDGAKFEHDIAVLVGTVAPRADQLDETSRTLSDQLQARLTALGHLPLPFYPSFEKDDDPSSGFAVGEAPLMFSHPYMTRGRSRLGILVETHSWRPYKQRVQSTYHMLQALFERAVTDARGWAKVTRDADAADLALRGGELVLAFDSGPHVTQLDFRGYAYDTKPSDLTGGVWISYDETKPQIWKVPLEDELVPAITVRVPRAGYIIDGGFAEQLAPILQHHGIRYAAVQSESRVEVEAFRATKIEVAKLFEGRAQLKLPGAWTKESRTLDRGAIFVPLDQPCVRLIVHMMDPASSDSFAQWGFLIAAFEQKEFMESYVIEEQARQMLGRDPSLRAQFDAAVAADPELAKSPERKREWFYRRHPAWDEKYNLLPIYRADTAPRLQQPITGS